jgi:hypothetical protein
MANYASDANLIKGAGKAYKNWENVPGMYKGLEDISKTAVTTVKEIKKEKKEEEEKAKVKAELKDKEAKKTKKKQDDAWWKIAGKVYENAGSFSTGVDFDYMTGQLDDLRGQLEAAEKSGDQKAKGLIMVEFNSLKAEIEDQKVFRDSIANPDYGKSLAVGNSGVAGGDEGKDLEFLTAFLEEKYTIGRNKEGDKTFTINGVTKTLKEIKHIAPLKDEIPFEKYYDYRKEYKDEDEWDGEEVYQQIDNIVPNDYGKLRAFLADEKFGGKDFKGLLNNPKKDKSTISESFPEGMTNKDKIKEEISTTIFDKGTMVDGTLVGAGDGIISDAEYEKFVEAIVDPYHEVWKNLPEGSWEKHARDIAIEQLSNGVENAWNLRNMEGIDEDIKHLD